MTVNYVLSLCIDENTETEEPKELVQGHRVVKQWSWDLEPGT